MHKLTQAIRNKRYRQSSIQRKYQMNSIVCFATILQFLAAEYVAFRVIVSLLSQFYLEIMEIIEK